MKNVIMLAWVLARIRRRDDSASLTVVLLRSAGSVVMLMRYATMNLNDNKKSFSTRNGRP